MSTIRTLNIGDLTADIAALAPEPECASYDIRGDLGSSPCPPRPAPAPAPVPDPCALARAALQRAEDAFQRARLFPPGPDYDRAEERVIAARCALRAAEHAAAKVEAAERAAENERARIARRVASVAHLPLQEGT